MNDTSERFVFVTQLDELYVYHFFNEFNYLLKKNKLWKNKEIIIINLPNFNESVFSNLKRFYDFYRLIDTSILIMKVLFHKFITKRLLKLKKSYSKIGIKIINLNSINSAEFAQFIQKSSTKVISISAPQIFSKELLNLNNISFFNVHCSPLPSYKGMMPNFWQMYFDENYTAVTLHKMEEKIDKGDILHQIVFPLSKSISLHQTMINSKLFSAHLINEYFMDTGNSKNKKLKENYFSFPKKQNGLKFKSNGGKIF